MSHVESKATPLRAGILGGCGSYSILTCLLLPSFEMGAYDPCGTPKGPHKIWPFLEASVTLSKQQLVRISNSLKCEISRWSFCWWYTFSFQSQCFQSQFSMWFLLYGVEHVVCFQVLVISKASHVVFRQIFGFLCGWGGGMMW